MKALCTVKSRAGSVGGGRQWVPQGISSGEEVLVVEFGGRWHRVYCCLLSALHLCRSLSTNELCCPASGLLSEPPSPP